MLLLMWMLSSIGSPKKCFLRLRVNAVYMAVPLRTSGKQFQACTQEYTKYSWQCHLVDVEAQISCYFVHVHCSQNQNVGWEEKSLNIRHKIRPYQVSHN